MNYESSGSRFVWRRDRLRQTLQGAVLALLTAVNACSDRTELTVLRGHTMGTTYTVKIPKQMEAHAVKSLKTRIDALLACINSTMSTYDRESELSKLNRHAADRLIELSDALYEVLDIARMVYLETSGAFDVTVGSLVNLWGFGPDQGAAGMPSPEEIDATQAFVGFELIELNAAPTLAKRHDRVYIDLSAIGKGYGVDRVADLLENDGFDNFMVEIGGEIRLRGVNADGEAWHIAVEQPLGRRTIAETVLHLSDTALASSGDYRNFREVGGARYGHTIDPRTGYPISHNLVAVTVLHDKAVWADAYATALMVLGPQSGPNLATRLGIAARFSIRDDGRVVIQQSPAYSRLVGDLVGGS